ncbi:hypothetical protein, partial [Klebsiella aerogenes]|uniref:hypothetical protein n=1 Tax=Klebsiella aerogenes TaxID=548 RepID=UPI001C6F07F0
VKMRFLEFKPFQVLSKKRISNESLQNLGFAMNPRFHYRDRLLTRRYESRAEGSCWVRDFTGKGVRVRVQNFAERVVLLFA